MTLALTSNRWIRTIRPSAHLAATSRSRAATAAAVVALVVLVLLVVVGVGWRLAGGSWAVIESPSMGRAAPAANRQRPIPGPGARGPDTAGALRAGDPIGRAYRRPATRPRSGQAGPGV